MSENVFKTGKVFGKLMEMIEVVRIPEGYENIDREVFAGFYKNLKKIICPSTLKTAGYRCFSCCNPVEEIELNYGLEEIEAEAFLNAGTLKSITIPNTVRSIGQNAFLSCRQLKTINIDQPEGMIQGAPWGAPASTEILYSGEDNE